jgi:hypothetical protein
MRIACKVFFGPQILLAACDENLLGRTLRFGEAEFEVKESFYFERFAQEEEFEGLIPKAHIVNLLGEHTIGALAKRNLLNTDNVKLIDGVPHIQIYRI